MDGCRDLYLSGYLHNQPPVFFTRCKVQTEGSEYEWISRDLFGEIEIHDYLYNELLRRRERMELAISLSF